ncbi:MAG TPA: methyltransferase domain-containing protein [Planctomycetota bacterium]|nr:methyltransferase domain-containing protein [Planctomycetota bacterium]
MSGGSSEFGVPIPGRVLPHEQWTKTGYRDPGTPFDWDAVFGRRAPRVVDLGCGNGRYLIGSALERPDTDHLGVDLVQVAIDHAAHRANQRGLKNVRFVTGDANPWLFERLGPDSVDEIHVYHPQPYYEVGDISKRLLTPEYLERLWMVLRRGGRLVLQTDNKSYWSYLLKAVAKHFEPSVQPGPWPDAPRGRTRREILARMKGLTVWRMEATRRDAPRAGGTARPDFDANRPRFRKRRKR